MDSIHIELAVIEMNLMQKALNFGAGVLDVAFPSSCLSCGGMVVDAPLPHVCDRCFSKIHMVEDPCFLTYVYPFFGEV